MCDKPWCTCEDVAFHEEELTRLRAALATAGDKNATLMRDLELACRDLAAVKLSRDAAEAKLSDEVRHADELAEALDDIRCSCTRVTISGVWTTLKCTRCHALTAHAARRARRDGQEGTR